MSQIMKAFMGVYMILFMMIATTGVLGVFFQVSYAQNLYAGIVDEIENSNYAVPVLRECFGLAEEAGYMMEVTLYPENTPYIKLESKLEIPDSLEEIKMARVQIKYPLQVAFFEMQLEREINGYAR